MKQHLPLIKLLLVLSGAIVFNIVFWNEKLALNAILFDVFITGSVFYLYPAAFTRPEMKWLLLAHLVSLFAVLYQNTLLSKIAFSTTLLLVVVFTQYLHRSVWYAAASALGNFTLLLVSFFENIRLLRRPEKTPGRLRKAARFIIIPLLIAGFFLLVYSLANAVFQQALADIAAAAENVMGRLFGWFAWDRFGFLLLGLLISGGLLLKAGYNKFSETDIQKRNDLARKKNNLLQWKNSARFDLLTLLMGRFANGVLALRNENTVGIISLTMLNLLLLVINLIDIKYLWFGFSYTPGMNLKDIVHEGTGMLIFSILLAMAVVLFFFRGNLNFYRRNKWLRYGAYGWIFQNAILVISVLLRDYYYISHMGLAYKRIGVLFFLLMVLAGLLTVFIKIHYKKTPYYLWRVNGWFAVVLLVAASCIHWDETMAAYNLARKKTVPVDVYFLLSLSDKTLPLLEANPDVLDKTEPVENGEGAYLYRSRLTPRQLFEMRKQHFTEQQQHYTWLSWNRADAVVAEKLGKPAMISSLK